MNIIRKNSFLPSPSFFDDFITRDFSDLMGFTNEGVSVPRVNIVETGDDFRVEMAAPGMKKDDFHIELDNEMLTIHSEAANRVEEYQDQNYTRREFGYGSFKRSFHLPNTVESDKIEAKYRDGILRLLIPKKEEARKKPVKTIAIS